jgi:hypothetical protein
MQTLFKASFVLPIRPRELAVTIIFGFTRKNVPLLCGDTLVTHFAEHPTTLRLPASGPLHAAISETFGVSVTGLWQKVNVIDDAVTLAWSGSLIAAYGLPEGAPKISKSRSAI